MNALLKLLSAILTGVLSYQISDKLKIIFNEAILNNKMDTFSVHLVQVIIFFVALFLLGIFSSVFNNLICWKGSKNIIIYSIQKMLKADYTFFLKKPPAAIWTELNMSSQQSAGFYSSIIELSSHIIEFMVYGFIIIRINQYAALYSICVIPLSFLLTFWMQNKLSSWRMKIMNASKNASAIAMETITGVKDVKVKNATVFFTKKLEQRQSELVKTVVVSSFYENYWISVTTLINSIAPLIVIYLLMGITNISTSKPGDIIILYSFIPLFLSSFSLYITQTKTTPFIYFWDALFKKYKLDIITVFTALFVLSTLLVSHRDISRYIAPVYPFIILAFAKFLNKKTTKIIFLLLVPAIILFAINHIAGNIAPIADWLPYL